MMTAKWMLVLFFWGTGEPQEGPSSKQFVEPFASRTECVQQQKALSDEIEERFPSTSTMSICMTKQDYDRKTDINLMNNPSFYKRD